FIEASLRGIAQVYFQNNPLSGLLILIAMFIQSTRVAVHGVIALVAGNLAGVLMGFDKSFLSCGLFGYNSFLVGLALATFYSGEKHTDYYWPVVIGAIVFACFSSILFVMLGKILSPYKTPPFTLPFNISTVAFLLATGSMNNVDMASVREPSLPSYEVSLDIESLTARAFFAGSIRGVGQVYLANSIASGVLVLIGIFICSRIQGFAAFFGSIIGAGVAAFVRSPASAIENGMYGFNPSLTMSAMLLFYVPSFGSTSIGILASVITVFIQLALATSLEPCGLPFMTLPFCFAALAFIVIQGTTSNVISVPLSSMTTPE
ncbi:urea transporter, partial [Thalassiosira pseudonana CCMP1335]